jgi:predicted permease
MDTFLQDLRYALRALARDRLLTAFVVLTFALGIGANTAVFGVVQRLLLEGPAHVEDPDRVMRLYLTVQPEGRPLFVTAAFGHVTYGLLRESARSLDGVAAYTVNQGYATYGPADRAQQLDVGAATPDLFPLLGTAPQLGRFFDAAENDPGAPEQVAVVSDAFWRRELGADPAAIGRDILLSDQPYRVVGVAPPGFTGPQLGRADVWIPMSLISRNVISNWETSWNGQWLQIVARLAPGVTVEQANTDATAVFRAGYDGTSEPMRTASLSLRPLISGNRGEEPGEAAVSRWLVGVGALALALACANIANLLLARALRRRREIAVRCALGAGRARVVRLLVLEALALAGAGALGSLAVAWALGGFLRSTLLPNVEWTSAVVSGDVLLLSVALAALVGVAVGIVPALRFSRPDPGAALGGGARDGGGRTATLRGALTVAQAAICTVLLVGAGLFLTSLARVRGLDLGIEPERALVATAVWPRIPFGTPREAAAAERARRDAVLRQARERLGRSDGVEHAGLAIGLPFNSSFSQDLRIDGIDSLAVRALGSPQVNAVSAGYFEAIGMRMLRGRAFGPEDGAQSEPVAIVNETMARTLWPDRDPLGVCLYTGDEPAPCSRIVGVVRDARRFQLVEEPAMSYYVPWGQQRGFGGTTLIVRPTGSFQRTAEAIGDVVRDLDPTVLYVGAEPLARALDSQIRPWRLGAVAFGLLSSLALLVAAVGLYSVMSYLVAQRTHEIGVRLALGASAGSVARLVMRSGVALAALGVALGAAAALALGRFLEPLLFQTSPRDPATFGAVAGSLLAVAALATLLPALRARRVSALEALRSD